MSSLWSFLPVILHTILKLGISSVAVLSPLWFDSKSLIS